MLSLKEFTAVIEEYAPLFLSQKMIEKGSYDNSGVLVKNNDNVQKILFTLDLSNASVDEAERVGADTIVTHHPAIYAPVKSLDKDGENAELLRTIRLGINVISMHLNLDIAPCGIDQNLALGLGAKSTRVLDIVDEAHGYGRESEIEETCAEDFLSKVKEVFQTEKVVFYGDGKVKKIASFCGSGGSVALSVKTDADTIITSDLAHHELKELIERGKKVLILPHYASEQYGFNKFYQFTKEKVLGKAEVFYYIDKRFM